MKLDPRLKPLADLLVRLAARELKTKNAARATGQEDARNVQEGNDGNNNADQASAEILRALR